MAQTKVNLREQAREVDFSGAVFTRPLKSGTVLPATCSVGDMYFKTNAAAGSNINVCVATNTWIVASGNSVASASGQDGRVLAGVAGSAAWTDLSGDVTGSASLLRVQKLQNRIVASTAPSSGQSLVWNGTLQQWEPQTVSGGGGGGGSMTIQNDGSIVGTRSNLNVVPGFGVVNILSDNGTAVVLQQAVDTAVVQSKASAQSGGTLDCFSTGASVTAYTCGLSPALAAYTIGMVVNWRPNVAGVGGNVTLNIDTLGSRPVKLADGTTNPEAGDLAANQLRPVWYVLALYISYYKTGFSQLAAYADQMAQYWWLHTDLGQNYNFSPRQLSVDGLAIAAQRGVVNATDVYTYVDNYSWSWASGTPPGYRNYIADRNTSTMYQNFYYGARESGYSWQQGLVLAQQHPSTAMQTTWQARLAINVQNHYRDYQCKASNPANSGRCRFPEEAFRWFDDAWSPHFAEQPWHTGIAMQGLIRYHRWTANSVARSVITDWVNHLMVNTQPTGSQSRSLYSGDFASSFPGVNCRNHYYWHQRGTETTLLTSGGDAAAGCGGGAEAIYGSRDSNNEIISSMGYAYRLTGSAAIKTRGDDIFGGTWGGDDGYYGQWA